jgi:hypothetical protein
MNQRSINAGVFMTDNHRFVADQAGTPAGVQTAEMRFPAARGAMTEMLFAELSRPPHELPGALESLCAEDRSPALYDEDLQLLLFVCYELHYRGVVGVDDRWEWQPSLLALRQLAEERFERDLEALVGPPAAVADEDVPAELARLTGREDGPSLSRFLQREATLEQFREFVTHRSIYHLKEADPHSWAIPRIGGRSKAALVEIQADEYGGGRLEMMHTELFRTMMRGLDLDDGYGAYVDVVPAITLAVNNLMSLFGLHRRRLPALLGHLAAFEMTSSVPNRRYSAGLARLKLDERARRFFDEHIQADAVHEQVAVHDLCGGLLARHPGLGGEVVFGAAACLALERSFAEHLLTSWRSGTTYSGLGAASAVGVR